MREARSFRIRVRWPFCSAGCELDWRLACRFAARAPQIIKLRISEERDTGVGGLEISTRKGLMRSSEGQRTYRLRSEELAPTRDRRRQR